MEKEKLTVDDLREAIDYDKKKGFNGKIIEFEHLDLFNFEELTFSHCQFIGENLDFRNSTSKIKRLCFYKCEFNTNVEIDIYNLNSLDIRNINISQNKTFSIFGSIKHFRFKNRLDKKNIEGDIELRLSDCNDIDFSDIVSTGKLVILNSVFNNSFIFNNTVFSNILLIDNTCKSPVTISNINEKQSSLDIHSSNFLQNIKLNNNKLSHVNLSQSHFFNNLSLQNTEVNKITLNSSSFDKLILLDGFKILNHKLCDRKTLRTIKQQFHKQENRIDFQKYREYELNAYKKELKGKKNSSNDLIILWLNNLFSRHGNNWLRALGMTLIFGLGFYSILYMIKNWQNEFDIMSGFDHFTSGYFKFFLVTNFYDPLSENREFLGRFIEWIPFIFGKIFIGYGLYETIQAFRKYRK